MKNRTFTAPWLWGMFLALMAALALPAQLPEATPVPPDPAAEGLGVRERLNRLVERVKYEQSRTETMQADFVQNEQSELLLEPRERLGRFLYRSPDSARWEYTHPEPRIQTIQGEKMTTWYVDLGTAKEAAIGRFSEQVLTYMNAANSLETLLEYFSVSAEFPEQEGALYHLQLTPDYRPVAKRITTIDIWVDPESFRPMRFRYVEPGGDETEIRFKNLVINEPIDEDQFVLSLPDDIEVTKVEVKL